MKSLHFEVLDLKKHDRSSFACGVPALDLYIQKQAGQDTRRGFAVVIVATDSKKNNKVFGYYSLSATSLDFKDLPEKIQKKMPRYPQVPAILLGRLALSLEKQGEGIGDLLLLDAFSRAYQTELGWAFFLVKAKDEKVSEFYKNFGFNSFGKNPLFLWLSREQVKKFVLEYMF